jgi:hypothetical protein
VRDRSDLMAVLDAGKVADMLLLVTHAHDCLHNKVRSRESLFFFVFLL